MARVALSCSLRNSVEVPKPAARYAHNHFCPSWNPPLMFATLPQAVDTSLPPAMFISDPVKHLSCAHRFHFHSLTSEIASFKLPREAPSARVSAVLSGDVCDECEEGNENCGNRSDSPS